MPEDKKSGTKTAARAAKQPIADDVQVIGETRTVRMVPSMEMMHFKVLDIWKHLASDEEPEDPEVRDLRDLLDHVPTRTGIATEDRDGRRVPVVIGTVADGRGRTRAGVRVTLLEEDTDVVLDTMRTTPSGGFVLRFPARGSTARPAKGRVRVHPAPDADAVVEAVTVPGSSQHLVHRLVVDDLRIDELVRVHRLRLAALAHQAGASTHDAMLAAIAGAVPSIGEGADTDVDDEDGEVVIDLTDPALTDTTLPGAMRGVDGVALDLVGDDPFDVLPVDMSPDLCDAVGRIFGSGVDTLLTNPSRSNDFRARRTRMIKRVTVPRIAPAEPGDKAPRRYLVTLRQEWRFLGYTLGEVTDIAPLDPGEVVDTATQLVQSTMERTSSSVSEVRRHATTLLESALTQLSSVDALVDVTTSMQANSSNEVATSTSAGVGPKDQTGAIIGGVIGGLLAGPLGALVGAGIGGGGVQADVGNRVRTTTHADLHTRATTRTNIDTSLEVNNRVRTAQSLLNTAINQVSSAVRSLRETSSSTVNQVSPLLSRVTNLLRWRVYENYAVCSQIEDVVELRDYPIFLTPRGDEPFFDDESIVEYRRFFEPALLEPRLAPHFDHLRRGLDRERMASVPINALRVTLRVSTNGMSGGSVALTAGPAGATRTQHLTIRPGASTLTTVIDLQTPLAAHSPGNLRIQLTSQPNLIRQTTYQYVGPIPVPTTTMVPDPSARISITDVDVAFLPGGGGLRTQSLDLGGTLSATAAEPGVDRQVPLDLPESDHYAHVDPLFLHVNRNATYYFSLLLRAAHENAALRDDIPHLRDARIGGTTDLLGSGSALWRLPIVGFEGNRVIIARDPDRNDRFVDFLLDDEGAATLVQIATPGAYGEALEGLLGLTDAVGRLHPDVLPLPAPAMPPLALVDMAGRAVPVTPPAGPVPTP